MDIFGIHQQSLLLHEKRSQVLAKNIANADTPNYKARDIDFAAMLRGQGHESLAISKTNPNHLSNMQMLVAADLMYRNPMQNSADGNTVDSQIEQAQFSENSVRYLASLNFIKQEVNQIMLALKGDN